MDKQISDRRVMKTKKIITDTFIELLKQMPIDKIRVTDLTEKANLNRGTFYLHYIDIYDLLEKSEDELFEELNLILSDFDVGEFISNQNNKPYLPIVRLLEWFKRNKNFGEALAGANGDIKFLIKMENATKAKLQDGISEVIGTDNETDNSYLSSFITMGVIGVIRQWLDNDTKIPAKDLAAMLGCWVKKQL